MSGFVEATDGFEDGVDRLALAEADDDARLGLLEEPRQEPVVLVVVVVAQDGQLLVDANVLAVGIFTECLHAALTVAACSISKRNYAN